MCSLLVSLVKASLLNILWQSLAYLQGYPSFFCCLGFLAILIAIVADIAQHIGCFTGIKESVISITILALGTSIPGSTQWANTRKKKSFIGMVVATVIMHWWRFHCARTCSTRRARVSKGILVSLSVLHTNSLYLNEDMSIMQHPLPYDSLLHHL
jgi:hypothetical protein